MKWVNRRASDWVVWLLCQRGDHPSACCQSAGPCPWIPLLRLVQVWPPPSGSCSCRTRSWGRPCWDGSSRGLHTRGGSGTTRTSSRCRYRYPLPHHTPSRPIAVRYRAPPGSINTCLHALSSPFVRTEKEASVTQPSRVPSLSMSSTFSHPNRGTSPPVSLHLHVFPFMYRCRRSLTSMVGGAVVCRAKKWPGRLVSGKMLC